jgi:hypothetical protein
MVKYRLHADGGHPQHSLPNSGTQESQNHLNTEKKWCLGVIQEEIEQQERDWKVEVTQLNQVSFFLSKKLDRMGLKKRYLNLEISLPSKLTYLWHIYM